MLGKLLVLVRHRVTWRFLTILLATLGYALYAQDLSKLEVALCTVLSCMD